MNTVLLIFVLTYLTIAIGYLPGFRIDRTGAAILGAIAMITTGSITSDAAWDSVDFGTLSLLFGLMIVSAAFYVAGFYRWVATKVAALPVTPPRLLGILIVISGVLSSLLTNDVVVVAMVPLLVEIALGRGLNPVPFLLGFCFAANAGSAGSMIGSPQNMIIAGHLKVSFVEFLAAGLAPSLLSLVVIWLALVALYRGRWEAEKRPAPDAGSGDVFAINRPEMIKATIVLCAVIGAFLFGPWPYSIVALAAAGALLLNRTAIAVNSSDLLKQVDGNLLLLVFSLYIINAAFSQTAYPTIALQWMASHGFGLHDPYAVIVIISLLSDLADNNSAVMLMAPYADTGHPVITTAAMALGAGFSSNIVNFGSLAGIIVVESAARNGVKISFMEFFRAGAIASLPCLLLAAGWIAILESLR